MPAPQAMRREVNKVGQIANREGRGGWEVTFGGEMRARKGGRGGAFVRISRPTGMCGAQHPLGLWDMGVPGAFENPGGSPTQRSARQIRRPCHAPLPPQPPPSCSQEAGLQLHEETCSLGALRRLKSPNPGAMGWHTRQLSVREPENPAPRTYYRPQIRRACRAALPPQPPPSCSQEAGLQFHEETCSLGALRRLKSPNPGAMGWHTRQLSVREPENPAPRTYYRPQIRRACRAALPPQPPPSCSQEAGLQFHEETCSLGALGEENLARTMTEPHASDPVGILPSCYACQRELWVLTKPDGLAVPLCPHNHHHHGARIRLYRLTWRLLGWVPWPSPAERRVAAWVGCSLNFLTNSVFQQSVIAECFVLTFRRPCRAALPTPTISPCSQEVMLQTHVETFGFGAVHAHRVEASRRRRPGLA